MYYEIKPDRRRRIQTRSTNIIIMHMNNLILKQNPFHDRDLLKGSYHYSWGKVQNYLIRHVNKNSLPMHYYIELLDNDYVAFKGLSEFKPSYFLQEMANKHIIDPYYSNSILIAVADDFNIFNPETRMYKHLSDKVLIPLCKQFEINFQQIKSFDEILSENYLNELENNRFEFKSMVKFDKQHLKTQFNIYNVLK